MNRLFLFTAAFIVVAYGGHCLYSISRTSAPVAVQAPVEEVEVESAPAPEKVELRTNRDEQEVFQRAFWREPGPEDRILHAERREWVSEKDGVRRWQWFIAVQPGAEFSTWLREQNPFSLQPVTADRVRRAEAPNPEWFPSGQALAGADLRQTSDGGMTVITAGGIVYATDTGHGFAVAAQSAQKPMPVPAAPPSLKEHQPLRNRPLGTASN